MTMSPYQAAQSGALGWEITDEDRVELLGEERKKFLNSYVTQDIQNLGDDRAAPAAFLTQKGKLVGEALVLKFPEKILLLFPSGYAAAVQSHLATFLLFAQVEWREAGAEWSHFALLGPKAPALLEPWTGAELEAEPGKISHREFQGHPCRIFASLRFGAPAWEILAPAAAAPAWRQAFREAAEQGRLLPADGETLELLRIEAGLPRLGRDMGEDNLVAEVGLDAEATSFNKGCYLGQETTARVQSRGHVNRKLGRVRLARNTSAPLPAELFQGEKVVGRLSSVASSPKFGATIGLATVSLAAWEKPETIFLREGSEPIPIERLP